MSRKRHKPIPGKAFIIGGAVVFGASAVAVAVAALAAPDDPPTRAAPPVVLPELSPETVPIPEPGTLPGDGQWEVPEGMGYGQWRSRPADQTGKIGCYIARLDDDGIVVSNKIARGPITVKIDKNTEGFMSVACMEWRKVS